MEQPDLSSHPLNEKLFIFRNIEDESNTEALEIFRELDAKFKQYDWYIGLAMAGSNTRNYNLKSSDIDFKLIYDASKVLGSHVVIDAVKLHLGEIESSRGLENRQVTIPFLVGLNIEKIRKTLKDDGLVLNDDVEHEPFRGILLDIKDLSGVLLGDKVDGYRSLIRGILSELPKDKRDRIIEKIVSYCLTEEWLSEEKFTKRTGISEQDLEKLRESRKTLWKRRLDKIWG